MVLAQYIETDLWNKVMTLLEKQGWEMTDQYDGIDAGIDYSCYTYRKAGEVIVFEWTNWDEGEIFCSPHLLKEIEKLINLEFKKVIAVKDRLPGSPNPKR